MRWVAALAVLAASSAFALTPRDLTGRLVDASGAPIGDGVVTITPNGRVSASVVAGAVVPLTVAYPVVAGDLACDPAPCRIESPLTYQWRVYRTVGGKDVLVFAFVAAVPEAAGTISVQEVYALSQGGTP